MKDLRVEVGKYTYMYESGKTFLSLILEVNTEKSTLTFVKFDENGVRKDGYYTAFFDKNNIPDMYDTEEEARIERFKKGLTLKAIQEAREELIKLRTAN